MLKYLLNLNSALAQRIQSEQLFAEAMALHEAKEYKAAFPVMRDAAEKGSPFAVLHLGLMTMQGRGTDCDWRKAGELFNLAQQALKESGNEKIAAEAKGNYGLILALGGYGLSRDIEQAQRLLEEAVAEGDASSVEPLRMVAKREGAFGQKEKSRPQINWKK